jgi:DNA-binding transcriptional LysR family regulator
MELRQIRYFVVLAETLHFGRAAALLHISQPPLSRQIALLEEELGVVLLDRTRRSVQLSAAGHRFYRDAKTVMATVDQARSHARAAELGDEGTLKAGFMFAAAYSIMPLLTRAYASAFPRVELKLTESIPTTLVADIRAGKADVGIMYPSDSSVELETRTIFSEQLMAVLPAVHPLCNRSSISIGSYAMSGSSSRRMRHRPLSMTRSFCIAVARGLCPVSDLRPTFSRRSSISLRRASAWR